MSASRLVIPDLAGKAVLVTGGSTGIGAAVARGLRRDKEPGSRSAITRARCRRWRWRREIEAAGGEALAVKGNVASRANCGRIVAETTARFGRLDGLINNAGLMLGRIPSYVAGDEHARAVIDLNARSVVSMTREAPTLA